jgi:uncharacterized protein (DUF362 family)
MTRPHSSSEAGRPRNRVTRREFLVGTATAAAVALLSTCGRRRFDPSQFVLPDASDVGVYAADSYAVDFEHVIRRGLIDLNVDVRGRRVFLKPNMVEYERDTAINTNAAVVVGAALAFLSAGAASVVVGEGPGHRRDIEYLLTQTGLFEHLREARIRFIDLNHDDVAWVNTRSSFTDLRKVALPVELLQSDFIVSMPKMKTHHWAGLTASMKNFFGAVPGAVYGWPKNVLHMHGIQNSILDLNATIRPHFSIVDGVIGMEGDGPIMGQPRHVGCLIMGSDLAAVDATCARVMSIDPLKIDYLQAASEFLGNIAESRIRLRGEHLARFQQEFALVDAFEGLRLRG